MRYEVVQVALVGWKGRISSVEPSDDRLGALGEWFESEHLALVRYATIVSGDSHVAEDLVQDVFVRAYMAGASVQHEFGAYARRAIVNLNHSRFRRRSAEHRAYAKVGHGPQVTTLSERDDKIWTALGRLAPRQRAVIALRFYEDLSEREIARTLGISPGSVKKHSSRGIERLRLLLEGDTQ